jgi:hypothetical protein
VLVGFLDFTEKMKCHFFRKTKTLVLFLLFFLFCNSSTVSGKVFPDKSILLEFKSSVSDPSGILSGWNSDNPDHCSWFGVSCDSNSRVSEISITGGGGYRGNSSQALSCSEFSELPYNGFGIRRTCSSGSGKLVGNLSALIGKLTELRVLSLPCNGLSGELPVEIWGLERLEVLDLEGSSLTGILPVRFPGLRKLRVLNLGFNRFEGEIPFSL